MTGGLIQLVAYGVQDLFLTHDPQITFFKVVYRRHTNFSIEQIPQDFTGSVNFGSRATCTISKRGDLIGKISLIIELPKVVLDQDQLTRFAWVRKVGYALIDYIEIEISDQVIDRHYGEWLNLWNELFVTPNKISGLNHMIGNIPLLTDFSASKESYTLAIPLQFWFCRNSGLSLPLISMLYSEVKINIQLHDADMCYILTPTNYIEVYNDIVNLEPNEYIEQNVNGVIASGIFTSYDFITKRLYYKKISRNPFQSIKSNAIGLDEITSTVFADSNLKYFIRGVSSGKLVMPKFNTEPQTYTHSTVRNINLKRCFLIIDYVYLDEDERYRFSQTKHDYLIEQVLYVNEKVVESTNRSLPLDLVQPCKLLVWVLQQDYLADRNNNDFFNYTDSYAYDDDIQLGNSFIISETIKLAANPRISKRSSQWFNHVLPYLHCYRSPSEGINIFNFCLHPDKYQPSGSCNMSQIDDIQADVSLSDIISICNVAKFRAYAVVYNVLRINNGISGIVFTK